MADLQFETEQEYAPQYASAEPSLFIRWVLAAGLVKTEKQAQYVLVGIIALGAVGILFFALSGFGAGGASGLSPADIQRITNLQQGVPAH